MLISSNSRQRLVINFELEEDYEYWKNKILRSQGFLDRRIDAYELSSVLGRGGFGDVFLAKHKNS